MTNKNSLLSISVALCATLTANAQTPFPTGTNVALSKPGVNSAAKVYTIYTNTDAANATFTQGVTFNPAYNINGIGLNMVDNLLYGAAFTGQSNNVNTAFNVSMFRIGSDGVQVDLGLLPLTGAAGSGALEYVNFSAGTVSVDGSYYYMTYAIKPAAAVRILGLTSLGLMPDLTTDDMKMYLCWKSGISSLPSNPGITISGGVTGYYELDFSNPDMISAFNAFLGQVNSSWPNVFDADGGVQDLAINPLNTKIYAYISYPGGGSTVGRPVVMNPPAAGISSVVPVGTTVNTIPGQEAAGVQFDAAGNMYTLFTTGDYAQVDLTTGALMGLTPSNLATTGGNLRGDLASRITNIPFPVKMVSFTGKNSGSTNQLNWITATEQNNKAFTIERSEDLKTWSVIGTELSKALNGNSSERLNYSFTDKDPRSGMDYYRLKQTDRDGKITYTKYISIQTRLGSTVSIFPNPANTSILINGVSSGSVIRIVDLTGKVVLTQSVQDGSAIVNLSTLSQNMYVVQVIENGAIVHTEKVIKK